MNQQQVNSVLDAIRALDNNINLVQAELLSHFNIVERRLANIEEVIIRQVGPNALPAVQAPRPFPPPQSVSVHSPAAARSVRAP